MLQVQLKFLPTTCGKFCGKNGFFAISAQQKRSTNPAPLTQDQYSLRAPPGARTLDTLIKSQVLYQLS